MNTLLPLAVFIACFTMTRVSSSSSNILAKRLLRTDALAYTIPFGATKAGYAKVRSSGGRGKNKREDTMNMVLQCLKNPQGLLHVHKANLTLALELSDASQARRIAVVVRNHDRWVKRLKIKDYKGTLVECRLGLPATTKSG